MSILRDIYSKSLSNTEQQIRYWKDYLNKLNSLDFNVFSEKLKIPALIPIGSKILFRGDLIHTNEVTVALGADYFAKCSTKQAEVLRKHRISNAESKLAVLLKEKEYIESQIIFNEGNLDEEKGQEIIEIYNEDEDKIWRQKHKENLCKYAQSKKEKRTGIRHNTTDEQLWERLEELELDEELRNELVQNTTSNSIYNLILKNGAENTTIPTPHEIHKDSLDYGLHLDNKSIVNHSDPNVREILNKAIDKQKDLEIKLLELKNRDRNVSKTENDIISRIEELEDLDELEDEINRLDDVLIKDSPEKEKSQIKNKTKERVSFNEDNETLELTFSHSENEPDLRPYDPTTGILKPSDIYTAFKLTDKPKQIRSILKKSKYDNLHKNEGESEINASKSNEINYTKLMNDERNIIVMNDIAEKPNLKSNKVEEGSRPPSLFKMKRLNKNK